MQRESGVWSSVEASFSSLVYLYIYGELFHALPRSVHLIYGHRSSFFMADFETHSSMAPTDRNYSDI